VIIISHHKVTLTFVASFAQGYGGIVVRGRSKSRGRTHPPTLKLRTGLLFIPALSRRQTHPPTPRLRRDCCF